MTYSFALALALLAPQPPKEPPLAPPPQAMDLSGYYSCTGQTVEGKYEAVVMITKKRNDNYLLVWVFQSGQRITGAGMRDGHGLWVGWSDQRTVGVCRYRIELENDKPKLVGDRGTKETLTYLKPY